MANISAYLESVLLNYSLRGTVATPAAWAVGLSLGVPASTSPHRLVQRLHRPVRQPMPQQ
jgi:hypothetical protein